MIIFACTLLLASAWANDDVQYVKSVKGGHRGGYQYNPYYPGSNIQNSYNNSQGYGGYGMRHNMTQNTSNHHIEYEVGVCYIEVPTASLVRDRSHIPAGNGSRSDLSRIRSCCKGYIRNIHNFRICDPVCTEDCVNALCSAPEVCTCFPDHVKNQAGICIPTCPIGCQNGHCSGGECLCKEGFQLDSNSKYCYPKCKENCGGQGNCTEPNICQCKTGYQSTPDGNCKPVCDNCNNGDCVAPKDCRCKPGYNKDQQGTCIPQCPQGCGPNGRCIAPNQCFTPKPQVPTQSSASQPFNPSNPHPLVPGSQISVRNQTNTTNTIGQPLQPGNQLYPSLPGQPGYPYPGQNNQRPPGYPYPGQNTQEQSGYRGQSGYQEQLGQQGNQGQTGYNGQSGYQGQTGYHGQSGYQGQTGYNGQTEYQGQTGYNRQTGYVGQTGTQGQAEYLGQSGYGQHGYLGNPESQTLPGYNGYPGNQMYPDNQQSVNPDSHFQCSEPCVNGVCIGGNKCQCNPGYLLDVSDPTGTRCLPNCPGGCPNGICSAPHFCICNVGYYKDTSVKGRPSCIKRIRRSIGESKPTNILDLLVFEIPY